MKSMVKYLWPTIILHSWFGAGGCSESDNDFLETCRASTLLAELEDDDELPEPDDEDDEDDENEDGNEDEDEEFEEVTVRIISP